MYIPCWDKKYKVHTTAKTHKEEAEKSNQLLDVLDQKGRTRWKEMSENNFSHSSRKAWSPINCLMGRISPPKPCPVMPVTPNPMPLLSLITVNGKTVAQRRKLTHIKSTLESKN